MFTDVGPLIKALKAAMANEGDQEAESEVQRLLEQFIERRFEPNAEKFFQKLRLQGVIK